MRIRPIVTLSVAAVTALLLAGCSASATPSPSASPSATAAADLCSAAAPSGAASRAVKVNGAFGTDSAATFASPLNIPSIQRTVVTEGTGTPIKAGDLVSYGLSAYAADTGTKLGSVGYTAGEVLPAQVSTTSPLGQVLGCATPGTRIVAAFPASESAAGEVYVFDLLSVVPHAAWGAAQAPVAGLPTVALDATGSPTITLPGTPAPADLQLETLKKGDGPVVGSGDQVLVQYTGVKWSDGTVFDSSWAKGAPVAFKTTGVVKGFQQALEGQTVGSQVLVVIPPALGYGADATSALKSETLVFAVDILGVQHAAVQ